MCLIMPGCIRPLFFLRVPGQIVHQTMECKPCPDPPLSAGPVGIRSQCEWIETLGTNKDTTNHLDVFLGLEESSN